MQLKPISTIVVLLLLVVTVSVAGCTSSSSSSTVSTDYPTSGRSKLIEGAVNYRKGIATEAESSFDKPKAFDVTWISNTKAKTHEERMNKNSYQIYVTDVTFTHYTNDYEASSYYKTFEPRYSFKDAGTATHTINYEKLIGKMPSVYHGATTGTSLLGGGTTDYMYQFDSLIVKEVGSSHSFQSS